MYRITTIILAICIVLFLTAGCMKTGTQTDITKIDISPTTEEKSYTTTAEIKQTSSQLTDKDDTTKKITEISKEQITVDEKTEIVNNTIEHARLDTIWLDEDFAKAEEVSFSREMNGVLYIYANGKYGLVSIKGKTLLPPIYNNIDWFYEDRASVCLNDKYGCVDTNGKFIIPVIYDGVGPYKNGFAMVGKEGRTGFFDLLGKNIIPFDKYDRIFYFSEGLAAIEKYGKWGYMDTTGRVVIPLIYDKGYETNDFYNGLAPVKKNGKKGYIDKNGEVVIPIIYDDIHFTTYMDGLISVSLNGKLGFVNGSGEVIIPFEYDHLYSLGSGFAEAEKVGKRGVIDKTGKIIIPFIYDSVDYNRDEELFTVIQNRRWGKIDKTGRIVILIESKKPYAANLYADIKDDKVGFSDINGEVVIPCIYDYIEESMEYRDGYFTLIKDNMVGVINNNGKIIIPFEYDFLKVLSNKCALVYNDGKTGFINLTTGRFIVPLMDRDNYIIGQNIHLTWILYNGKWCVIDKNGEIFTTPDDYDEINAFDFDCTVVRKDGRWGIVRYVSGEDDSQSSIPN